MVTLEAKPKKRTRKKTTTLEKQALPEPNAMESPPAKRTGQPRKKVMNLEERVASSSAEDLSAKCTGLSKKKALDSGEPAPTFDVGDPPAGCTRHSQEKTEELEQQVPVSTAVATSTKSTRRSRKKVASLEEQSDPSSSEIEVQDTPLSEVHDQEVKIPAGRPGRKKSSTSKTKGAVVDVILPLLPKFMILR